MVNILLLLFIILIYISNCCHCTERPKPKVTIKPAQPVFRGETVTLRCDIYDGVTRWRYRWYKEGSTSVFSELQEHTFSSVTESDAGKYSCNGFKGSRWSQRSDTVTLTVSGELHHLFINSHKHMFNVLLMSDFSISDPRAVLSVSPQKWLTEGDPVTLICEVHGFSTGWTFSWFTLTESPGNL